MYIVFLRFSDQQHRAGELMPAHKAWIDRGIADGVFLMVGSLAEKRGGAVLAHGVTRAQIEACVLEDPFVMHDVVTAEIIEVTPARADPRLAFLFV